MRKLREHRHSVIDSLNSEYHIPTLIDSLNSEDLTLTFSVCSETLIKVGCFYEEVHRIPWEYEEVYNETYHRYCGDIVNLPWIYSAIIY